MTSVAIAVTVNGCKIEAEVEPHLLLANWLRDRMGLTGTHIGCDTSQCGACVVHVGGKSVKSCAMLAAEADGLTVVTIEGLAKGDVLHPMQQAFHENHGLQCGFCTSGMVMSAVEVATLSPKASEAEVRAWLEGNFCRCTGYQNIVKSVLAGAAAMTAGREGGSR
jgi:aerobic carbon-monoxide dehydrogenase small subunit